VNREVSVSVLTTPPPSAAPEPSPAVASPALDPLVTRHLAAALHPGVVPADAAEVRLRGVVRVGPAWLPLTAVDTVAPRRGYALRARVLGMVAVTEEQHGDEAVRRTSCARLVTEDDSVDALRRARTHRALAALWVPGALRPGTGARWERLDRTHLRVVADDLDLRLHVHQHGHVLGLRTQGWGDPYVTGRPRWAEIGYEVHEWRTFGGVCIPSTVVVGWYPGTSYGREIARLQLTSWEPRDPEAFR
jgi:hypothetical protein